MPFGLSPLVALLLACQAGPTFSNIESIKVTRVGSDGLHNVALSATDTKRAADCLYTTTEVEEGDSAREMLPPDVYLVEIKDSAGIRSFEMYTARHLKGNKGKYYRNECLFNLFGGT